MEVDAVVRITDMFLFLCIQSRSSSHSKIKIL